MVSSIISNGFHYLSGFSYTAIYDEYNECYIDGVLITIDGKNYVAYEDVNDGYRSYGCFHETQEEQTNKIPKERVYCLNRDIKGYDDTTDKQILEIYSVDDEGHTMGVIAEIGTDYTDSYYPMAIVHFYPENLSINKGRK